MSIAVDFQNVDIIFGDDIPQALRMVDVGASRADILAKTGAVLGAAGASLIVNEGEISVLMACQVPASRRCCARSTASTRLRAARCW